eukprot:12421595-Karenia_brevis.AAC.1
MREEFRKALTTLDVARQAETIWCFHPSAYADNWGFDLTPSDVYIDEEISHSLDDAGDWSQPPLVKHQIPGVSHVPRLLQQVTSAVVRFVQSFDGKLNPDKSKMFATQGPLRRAIRS